MITIYPIIGLLFVAAITPGPNNILVMQASLRGGASSAALAIFGVISGTMFLYLIVAFSLERIMGFHAYAINVIAVLGAAYLAYMGGLMVLSKPSDQQGDNNAFLPTTFKSIAIFQLLNPKAWILVSTVVAGGQSDLSLIKLAFVVVLVTALCLTCWAILGLALSKTIRNSKAQCLVNIVIGISLMLFAIGIVVHQFSRI